MRVLSILLSLCLALALLPSGSLALTQQATQGETKTMTEEEVLKLMDVAQKFTNVVPEFKGDDALALAKLVENVKADEESMMILEKMKAGEIVLGLEEDVKKAEHRDLVLAMINLFDELKAIDYLFQDPVRAVEAVNQEGMIGDEEKLNFYRQNPAQLKEDMRGGLYISFVYIAHVGGYL